MRATTTGFGSFVGLHLGADQVTNYRESAAVSKDVTRLLHLALLNEGVACAPRMAWNTTTAMDEATIDDVLARFRRTLAFVRPAMPSA